MLSCCMKAADCDGHSSSQHQCVCVWWRNSCVLEAEWDVSACLDRPAVIIEAHTHTHTHIRTNTCTCQAQECLMPPDPKTSTFRCKPQKYARNNFCSCKQQLCCGAAGSAATLQRCTDSAVLHQHRTTGSRGEAQKDGSSCNLIKC